ncbi:hypothetical protein BDY21DRAFT_354672 [Lineolata rhizophorae]|uniref:Uncharacterized protein n=1 Tax=Lineolata rhizophorae TaxID=578093 RepID=A0A6A6NQB3_9PEZI|nr:hypothetical protein BDY21DRAFT_354672 [Lineolata rhizophorae]
MRAEMAARSRTGRGRGEGPKSSHLGHGLLGSKGVDLVLARQTASCRGTLRCGTSIWRAGSLGYRGVSGLGRERFFFFFSNFRRVPLIASSSSFVVHVVSFAIGASPAAGPREARCRSTDTRRLASEWRRRTGAGASVRAQGARFGVAGCSALRGAVRGELLNFFFFLLFFFSPCGAWAR